MEEHVLVGAGAVILGNVNMGKGSVIEMNVVVISNIPEYEVWGGIPAKRIKEINNGDQFSYFK